MKKIILLTLLCTLLLLCIIGCDASKLGGEETTMENNGETTNAGSSGNGSDNASEVDILELNELFDTIRNDSEKNIKLDFSVEYEQIYFDLKESGQYDNADWSSAVFIVTVSCDYEMAINEDWYKQCSEKDIKSLNAAFYNHYGASLSKGNYSNIVFSPGMHLMYYSPEDFNDDYAAIKGLIDLDCVTEMHIVYNFPVPNEWFLE